MNKLKSSVKNIALTPVDDLFSSEESRADAKRELVVELPLTELHPFKNHPFKVMDDDKMQDTAKSIREHGVLVPAIVRPREDGGYEIVSGHRRHHASQIAGLDTMPAIIRDLDLRKPIYRQLAAYGHMGREELGVAWEKTDRVDALKEAIK